MANRITYCELTKLFARRQKMTTTTRYIKWKEMIRLTGKSKPTIWRMYAKRNEFPRPERTKGGTFLGWPEHVYEEWVRSEKL